jgi:hypothetical protein
MLKNRMFNVIVLLLISTNGVWSQKVVRRTKNLVLVEITFRTGIKVGDQFDVYRKDGEYQDQNVGKIKLLRFQGVKYAAQIVSENSKYPIRTGDYLKITRTENEIASDAFMEENLTSSHSQTQYYAEKSNNLSKYILFGSGILSCGLGYSFNSRANSIYDDYKNAKTAEDATRLYDDAVRYDRNTNIAVGMGAGLIVFGVVYPILRPHTVTTPKYSLSIFSSSNQIQFSFDFPIKIY